MADLFTVAALNKHEKNARVAIKFNQPIKKAVCQYSSYRKHHSTNLLWNRYILNPQRVTQYSYSLQIVVRYVGGCTNCLIYM